MGLVFTKRSPLVETFSTLILERYSYIEKILDIQLEQECHDHFFPEEAIARAGYMPLSCRGWTRTIKATLRVQNILRFPGSGSDPSTQLARDVRRVWIMVHYEYTCYSGFGVRIRFWKNQKMFGISVGLHKVQNNNHFSRS